MRYNGEIKLVGYGASSRRTGTVKLTKTKKIILSFYHFLYLIALILIWTDLYIYYFQLEIITNINEETFVMTQHYCQQLYYMNFSINFVLYCISGQNFRKALRSLHCPRRRLRRNETAALTGITFCFFFQLFYIAVIINFTESRTQSSVFSATSRRRRLPTFTESQETTNSTKLC